MQNRNASPQPLWEIIRCVICVVIASGVSCAACFRMMSMAGVDNGTLSQITGRLDAIEIDIENGSEAGRDANNPLHGKKIVYDGDSIAEGRENNGGAYAAVIAQLTGSTYENLAKGGARLCSTSEKHSIVDNLSKLPKDGDMYCFQGGINDYWANTPIGVCDPKDDSGKLDTKTICGAMETIFRYCLENFPGKPICFVITHKIQNTAAKENANGDTFADYRNAMIKVCQKYSVPYYDAFGESGLNGWHAGQNEQFLTGNSEGTADGIHPNAEGYKKYYVPQLLYLFERIIPVE